jgi:hypothetical protein
MHLMAALRRRLRVWVTTWLVFQVVSLSALVPRDCCEAHRAATAAEKSTDQNCHEDAAASEPAAGDHCPMPGVSGAQCPMHGGGHDRHRAPAAGCSMQRTCDGPMAALFVIISNQGVLTAPLVIAQDLSASIAPPAPGEDLVSRCIPPDSPPPRA